MQKFTEADVANVTVFAERNAGIALFKCVLTMNTGERFEINVIASEEPSAESLIRRFMVQRGDFRLIT